MLICFVKCNLVKIWTHMVLEFTKYVICVKVAFTRYLKKHPYSTLSASGSLRIWHISIHICNRSNLYSYLYWRLSVFESEFSRKCENNYNIDDIVRIRFVYTSLPAPRRRGRRDRRWCRIAGGNETPVSNGPRIGRGSSDLRRLAVARPAIGWIAITYARNRSRYNHTCTTEI